jgi:hypothetical protein
MIVGAVDSLPCEEVFTLLAHRIINVVILLRYVPIYCTLTIGSKDASIE